MGPWRGWRGRRCPGIYRGFFTSYKAQIAAYELDKLLKMDMVPPTVERQLQGNTGAATLWVENVDDVEGRRAAPGEANRREWDKQLARMTMFDALIGNREPKPGKRAARWGVEPDSARP